MTEVLARREGQQLPTDATVAVGDIAGNAPEPAPEPVAPASAPRPVPIAQAVPAGGFANCTEARAAGAAPLYVGSPGYAPKLGRDGDGIACE